MLIKNRPSLEMMSVEKTCATVDSGVLESNPHQHKVRQLEIVRMILQVHPKQSRKIVEDQAATAQRPFLRVLGERRNGSIRVLAGSM